MTSDQGIGIAGLISKINWSAVSTAVGAVVAYFASHSLKGVSIDNIGDVMEYLWPAVAVFAAAYKGTAKGSLKRKAAQPVAPVNDEGM